MGPPPLVHDLRGGRVLRFVQEPARAVFIMIGAEPPTELAAGRNQAGSPGYLMTGDDAGRIVIGSVHRYVAQLSDPGPYP